MRPPAEPPAIRQVAALPYRVRKKGKALDILLVTSRDTGRWIVPKGNLRAKTVPHAEAALEAEEEGGVRGQIAKSPLGRFSYLKRLASGREVRTRVLLFALKVDEELDDYKEMAERKRHWFPADEAAEAVTEAELAALIKGFRPKDK